MAELGPVLGTEVGDLMLFAVAPDVLGRVELRRRGWQTCESDGSRTGLDILLHQPAAMCLESIPDGSAACVAMELPAQVAQKVHDLRALDRAGIQPEIERPDGHHGDHGQPLSQLKASCNIGVCTRRAHVRTRCGRSLSPDSSTKTRVRPSATAFVLTGATRPVSGVGSRPRPTHGPGWSTAGNSSPAAHKSCQIRVLPNRTPHSVSTHFTTRGRFHSPVAYPWVSG